MMMMMREKMHLPHRPVTKIMRLLTSQLQLHIGSKLHFPHLSPHLSPIFKCLFNFYKHSSAGFNYRPPGSKDSIFLTYSDIDCLGPDQFLNDTIINFYLKYLYYEQFSAQQQHSTHLFNSFFYSKLCAAHPETGNTEEERA